MENDVSVEIAVINNRLTAITGDIAEIKESIKELTHAVVGVPIQQKQWDERLRDAQGKLSELESKLNNDSAYINKLRGGFSLLTTILVLIQAVIVAGAGWLISQVVSHKEDISILKQADTHFQTDMERLERAVLILQKGAK